MPRKKTSEFESYESKKKTDRHARITRSMIDSDAWRELGVHEVAVYLMLKNMHFKKTQHGAVIDDNRRRLIITFKEARECLKMSGKRFKKAIDKLESVGLIEVVQRSRNMKHANIYGLSDKWHNYKAERPGKKWPTHRKVKRSEEVSEDGLIRVEF